MNMFFNLPEALETVGTYFLSPNNPEFNALWNSFEKRQESTYHFSKSTVLGKSGKCVEEYKGLY
jgi:hypothetical protein